MGQQPITERPPGVQGLPIVKFRQIGQRIVGGMVKEQQRQQQNWRNGKAEGLKFKDDGRPALELVLTLMVMPGSTAVVVDQETEEDRPVIEGELVRVIINGFKWKQYIEQRDLMGKNNQPLSGDLFAMTHTSGSVKDGRGGYMKLATPDEVKAHIMAAVESGKDAPIVGKDMEILVKRPGPEHIAIVDQCNAKRAELAQQPVGAGAPAGGGYSPATDDPF